LFAYLDAFNAGEWERLKNLCDPVANIRGVLAGAGLDVAMPICRELHDSMNMHLEIEPLVQRLGAPPSPLMGEGVIAKQ
jgi:hypothetical protein